MQWREPQIIGRVWRIMCHIYQVGPVILQLTRHPLEGQKRRSMTPRAQHKCSKVPLRMSLLPTTIMKPHTILMTRMIRSQGQSSAMIISLNGWIEYSVLFMN